MTEQEKLFAGGGEMGALMRAMDWSRTALGPVDEWPLVLKTTVSLMLSSPLPMCFYWGPDLVFLYNDGITPIMGAKHPSAICVVGPRVFPEIWSTLSPMLGGVLSTGTAVYAPEQPLFIDRQGFAEEGYYSWSFMPLRVEHGHIAGILCIVNDATTKVLGERRFRTLREMSLQTSDAQDRKGVLRAGGEAFKQNSHDLPFVLLYGVEDGTARLALHSGLDVESVGVPRELKLDSSGSPWPLAEVVHTGQPRLLETLPVSGLQAGPWPEPVRQALVMPVFTSGECDAVLVTGLSPRLPLNESYHDFLQLLGRQLSAELTRTRAIEQEKQRVAQLAEMDRVKTAFFSNVSHEFRTPLTLMLGPTENALASPEQALRGEDLQRVYRNELRLLKLVNTLLDLSRLEAGRTQGRFKPTDLAHLTAGLASAFDSVMVKAGLNLEVDCPPLPEPVWVDPDMWEKIVLNLVSNAFKFTLQGEISVRLQWRDDRVELSVRDTGTGIALEQQPRIFERFHRVEGARGRSDEGTGIGLSLVRELVALHGGGVRVDSTPGQGSTFTVSLPTGQAHLPRERVIQEPPRVSTATGATAFLQEAEQWLGPSEEQGQEMGGETSPGPREGPLGHVLLADDNADMRDYMARLLQRRFTVETVADGWEALATARARPPDAVISDVMMPGLDGFGLVRELKADARTEHLPVMLISARASEKAALEGFSAGIVDYMVKPFRAPELLARTEAIVKAAQARAESRRLLQEVQAAREQAEALAKQLNIRVDFEQKLLGIVSHDLRNPLSAILLGTAMLARRSEMDARNIRSLVRIQGSAERASRMVKDLLDFTQARLGGGLKIVPHSMDLHVATLGVVEEVEVVYPTRMVEVSQKGEGTVRWDADRFAQMMQNLLTNALKYSPEDSRVKISVRAEKEEVFISIANQGAPIPEDKLASIFEPMQRATAEIDKTGRSVGLGLYIVKQIVAAHGGHIDVVSTPEEGTRFTVRLPRQSA